MALSLKIKKPFYSFSILTTYLSKKKLNCLTWLIFLLINMCTSWVRSNLAQLRHSTWLGRNWAKTYEITLKPTHFHVTRGRCIGSVRRQNCIHKRNLIFYIKCIYHVKTWNYATYEDLITKNSIFVLER